MHRHPPARGALRLLAVAAALAAAAPADAAPRTNAAAATVRAAPPAPPVPPADAAPPRSRAAWLAVHGGAWSGLDLGTSLALHVDYGLERTPASWRRLALEVHLAAMMARPTDETDLSVLVPGATYPFAPVSVPAGVEETSAWVVEVVPFARVRLPFERFALFADGGVGLAQTLERVERDELFAGVTTTTENVTGLVVRLGAGMSFDLSPRTRLLFVPVALSYQLGPSYSAYAPSLGLSYRL